jgi:hypothetical protein
VRPPRGPDRFSQTVLFLSSVVKSLCGEKSRALSVRRGRLTSSPPPSHHSPRYDISHTDVEDWVGRLLPSRLFGVIVLTTANGIVDHEEARRKKVGGKVLGFFY